MRIQAWLTLLLLCEVCSAADPADWERSVVTLDITRKQYDYLQPWSKRTENFRKSGLVVGPRQILTTAEYLNDGTLVRVQKGGRGTWWTAKLEWIDYQANLATLTVAEDGFWSAATPAVLAARVPRKGSVEIIRWRNGILETRKGEINRLQVKRGKLGFIEYCQLEVVSEINAAGWAEIVAYENQVVGLAVSQEGNNLSAAPATFIQFVLRGSQERPYRGLGFFDFVWHKTENPDTLKYFKLPGGPRGVMILDFTSQLRTNRLLKVHDIILRIDGFDLDTEGDYADPDLGKVSLENLSSRQRWAGDAVRLSIWREGKPMEIDYRLPRARYTEELVPEEVFDQEPEYLMVGGLVFQPLTVPYLRIWGADWRRKAPFRLGYYTSEKATPQRPGRVVLSLVWPDPYNLGYQDYRFLGVERVNGKTISTLADLSAAFQAPKDGFHIIEFGGGEALGRMVLDAAQAETATRRVQEHYGIQEDRRFLTRNSPGE